MRFGPGGFLFHPAKRGRLLERGMYAWGTDHVATSGARDAFIAFCQAQNVDTVFLDMYGMLGSSNYDTPGNVAAVQDLIGRFKALGSGKKVYALAGDPSWSIEGEGSPQPWVLANIIQKVVLYNSESTPNQEFDGLHFDVEYWTDGGQTAESGISGLQTLMQMTVNEGLPAGLFAAFYLSQTEREAMIDMAHHVVVGTYRDTAEPNLADEVDGVINLMQPWYDYAAQTEQRVYSAIETIDIAPAYITFFGQSKAAMEAEAALVNAAFTNPAYKGLVVHHYAGWSALT